MEGDRHLFFSPSTVSRESREAEKHKLHILSKSNIQDPKD